MLPTSHVTMIAKVRSPTVQGSARRTSVIAGVGKAMREGPRSPWTKRRQKFAYLLRTGSFTPYMSVSASRIAATPAGLMCERAVMRERAVSTGLTGDRWVMKNAADTPANTTAASRRNRRPTNRR
jgi:hypothetical protein